MLLEYGNIYVDVNWKVVERIPPGYSRVYYVYSGEVEYMDDQQQLFLKPGYLYIFPSASPYRMKQNPDNRLDCTFFHIDIFPSLITDLVEVEIDGNPVMKHILSAIAASIDSEDINLTHALVGVFETYCKEHHLLISPIKQISNVLLYIDEHMNHKMGIEELCGMAGYNEQYFIRLFKKAIGMTPYQYIISYRLKEAKKLLIADTSVTQISKATGYSDIKSFSRSFKKCFGISPTKFRKIHIVQP